MKIFFWELNSSRYALSGGTAITNGANLDNYTTPGNYYATSNAIAESLSNSPITAAFIMKVEHANGTDYPRQTIRQYATGDLYTRYQNWSGIWQPWITYPTRAEVDALNSNLTSLSNRVGANSASEHVDITNYTSTPYVAPSDGYVTLNGGSASSGYIRVYAQFGNQRIYQYMNVTVSYTYQTFYVKQGMQIYVTGNTVSNGTVHYTPLAY